ncbi:hypothetical protein [Pseudoalteromonas sp. NJ631]|uniref:hypothetical protein n=1 Tax=Pseudoalteromonas sp. NJ631 TaxID=493915 RepID=UPI0003781A5F|nr:hypothetical protein [Pseudoalteromonas sp. NJ631]
MISKVSNKKLFLVWTACILIYLVYVGATESSFSILVISGLTNICLLPLILRKHAPLTVKDPIEYVKFNEVVLLMGELKIPTSKIKKVALDVLGEDAYFSLPYNQISPGQIPSFVFPAVKIATFKSYLMDNLSEIEFIT